MPVLCNVLYTTRKQALSAPRGDIRLASCTVCGYVWNAAFDAALVQYGARYENALQFSPRFQDYAKALAAHLVERHDLHGRHVVEIGCGDGYFLNLVCELGGNRGLGFDPGYRGPSAGTELSEGVAIVPEAFSERHVIDAAGLVCCRHTLEHVADPVEFLGRLRRVCGAGRPAVFFEVPNAVRMLRDVTIWDVIYEHCSYFSPPSLARLFWESG
ncbi:MAG: class I SAM-dependent methyltransferase, partial [Armatimonadota bacterium]